MDDLRASLAGFDPSAPLASAPDPWGSLPMPAMREGPPWAMAESIAAQPELAGRIVDRIIADGSAARLADALLDAARAAEPVVVTGCGTSEHAAIAIAEILRDAWREAGFRGPEPVGAQAFELALDPTSGGLVIGISHEGGTTATIDALKAAHAGGARTAVITGSAGSPAGEAAEMVVATVELDRSWCHTIGYVAPIVVAAVVAGIVARSPIPGSALRASLDAGVEAAHAKAPDGERPDARIATGVASARHLLVLGSGADRVTARELTLKVEEAAWIPSAMRDLETFLHGHLPATGADTALILVLLERRGLAARSTRARQALAAAGATGMRPAAILSVDAAAAIPEHLTPGGRIVVPDDASLPDSLAAVLGGATPLQLVTLAIAEARGTNPDAIRRDDPVYLRAAELGDAPDP
jgi:glucosamine--fructose-6-phosphate aminotransferase (isomerizing)